MAAATHGWRRRRWRFKQPEPPRLRWSRESKIRRRRLHSNHDNLRKAPPHGGYGRGTLWVEQGGLGFSIVKARGGFELIAYGSQNVRFTASQREPLTEAESPSKRSATKRLRVAVLGWEKKLPKIVV